MKKVIAVLALFVAGCSGRFETSHDEGHFGPCISYEFNASHVDLSLGSFDWGGGCVWITDLNPACADLTTVMVTWTGDQNGNKTSDPGEPQKHAGGKLPPGSQSACFNPQTIDLGFDLGSCPSIIDLHVEAADGSNFDIIHGHAPPSSSLNGMPRMGPQWTWVPQYGVEIDADQTGGNLVTFAVNKRTDSRTNDLRTPIVLRLLVDGQLIDDFDTNPLQVIVPFDLLAQHRYGAKDADGLSRSPQASKDVKVEVYDANGLLFYRDLGPVWAF